MNFYPERDRRGFDGPLIPQPNENPMMRGCYRPSQMAKVIISTTCVLLPCRPGLADQHATGSDKSTGTRPNIVLIMADDLGYSDVGCYGSEIPTPHIDSLARDGIRFSQFYDCAVCVPTRASLLTGLYPHQAGRALAGEPGWTDAGIAVAGDDLPPHEGHYRPEAYGRSEPGVPGGLRLQCVTLADLLGKAGYRTLMSGKWHCGEATEYWPVNRGFDRYFGLLEGAANYFNPAKDYLRPRTLMMDREVYRIPDKSFYMTDAISDYAVRFLDEYARDERPFFLYVPYTAPHAPLQARPEDIRKFKGRFSDGWDVLRRKRYQRLMDEGIISRTCALSPRDDAVNGWRLAGLLHQTDKLERRMEVYAAQVASMDAGIGKVLARLKALDVEDNTVVIFLSDNGAYGGELDSDLGDLDSTLPPGGENSYESYGRGWANLGSTPFRLYKTWLHEGGIAAPLIVRWPAGVKSKNAVRRDVTHVMDILPTMLDLAGGRYPDQWNGKETTPLEGRSLAPVLTGKAKLAPRTLYWENFGHRAVRSGDWKLVAKHRRWELYNLKTDRSEMRDVAGTFPDKVRELAGQYDHWAKRVGAGVPPRVASDTE
jgi:arylsulfatase A-like enzyme